MKRFLVFLAVFVAGLAILLWIQSRLSKPAPVVAPSAAPSPSTEPQGELTTLQTEGDKQFQVGISGPINLFNKWRPSFRLRSHITAKNSTSISDGVYDLSTVVLQYYTDTSPSELESEIHASSARAKINANLRETALDETYPITLFDVIGTLQRGSRFSPLTLHVPVLEGVYGTQHFESHEQVTIEGRGLSASGHGLVFDGLSETMRLQENPDATVEFKAGDTARLSSRGELFIHSRPDLGPDVVELEARDNAALRFESAQPFALNADLVRLYGVLVQGANERFVPTRAEAEGHVTFTPNEGVFSGNTAIVDFDPNGKPLHAALDGDPRCNLVLRGAVLENVPSELLVEGETLTVTLDGAGPLELFFDAGERFEFTGPATLRLPVVENVEGIQATLHGNGSIGGALGSDGRFHQFDVRGGATLDYEGAHVDADDLIVTEFMDEQQHAAMRLVAVGPTHSTGTLLDGRKFDLTTTGGMTAERRREGFVVPKGDGVEIVVTGEHAFRAHADHLRDFDAQQLTLAADGHVHYENAQGRGDGEHIETFAPQRGELTGTVDTPARFAFEQGTFQANFIEFEPDRVQARIDARAKVTFGRELYDLSARWVVVERNPTPEDREPSHGYVLDAGGDVHARVTNDEEVWNLGTQTFHAVADVARDEQGNEKLEPAGLWARNGVTFDYMGKLELRGTGDRLEVSADRVGHLYPSNEPDAKVDLAGRLPDKDLDFTMRATSVDFSPERLIAVGPEIDVQGLDLPWAESDAPAEERAIRAVAGRVACDRNSIFFSEGVYVGGHTPTHEDWSIDAPRVLLSGSGDESNQNAADAVHDLVAWGGFVARIGTMGTLSGEHMQLVNSRRTITIAGEPATIQQPEAIWSSPWFDLDLDTGFVRSESGEVRATGDSVRGDWTMRYESLEPITSADETIQVMREPVITTGNEQVRASWAVVWVDATEWGSFTGTMLPKPGVKGVPQEPKPPKAKKQRKPKNLLERFKSSDLSKWLREFYLEGNVEYRVQDQRHARAEAAYFDLVEFHGWLRDVDLSIDAPFFGNTYALKVQAEWMHVTGDLSMEAFNAVATSCTYDEPHYVIHIGNYTRKPRWKESSKPPAPGEEPERELLGYDYAMTNNSIASPGGAEIPFPPLAIPTDPNGVIDAEAFDIGGFKMPSLGKDSKFGTFISMSVTTPLGWFSKKFGSLFNKIVFPKADLPVPDGNTRYSGAIYGWRGARGGLETEMKVKNAYDVNVRFDLIYDTGEDHGLVRVPESDRNDFRGWFRERGRFFLEPGEWIDAVISYQSDPGVQAEFFERDYLEYEERETYLHWRRAAGVEYWSATLEARLEDFRTEVVDQPTFEYFHGRAQVGSLGKYALLYSSDSSLAHLARFDGDPAYEQPFPDGLGDRDVVRFDTSQRIDMPMPLGVLGLRATPFVEARVTGWSENAAEDSRASRAALLGGAEIASTFWKRFDNGSRHVWSPSVSYHGDFASTDDGQPVVFFDPIDEPLDGQFIDVAVRSRWEQRELKSDLDIELRQTYATDAAPGEPEGWLPLIVRGSWLSSLSGMPFGMTHDAHYDTASGETDYSRTFFGWDPRSDLELETGYSWARDLAADPLYSALSVGARFAFSKKWEIEGHETFSVKDNGDRLASALLLRRIGHDFVIELDTSVVAGEGSSSFSFNITPLLTWKPSDTSMLDRWRALRR